MYLGEMEAEVYDHFGYGDNPSSQVVINRVRRELNTTYREILAMKGLSKLRRKVLTFASVANSPYAVLPQAASRLIVITDRTNMIPLDEMLIQDLRRRDPGQVASTSSPYAYVILNLASPVARDPSAAAELFTKSTSAADGTGVDASLSGIITGGYQRSTHGPLNGTVGSTIDASITTWTDITKFFLNNLAKGTVTLLEGSVNGTELARIAIGRSSARYSRIILYPTPTVAVTYYADVELNVEPMTQAYDECILHEDFHWLLPCGTIMREYQRKEKHVEHSIEKARWKQGISDLKAFVGRPSGAAHRSDNPPRFSQLGSNFRAGS